MIVAQAKDINEIADKLVGHFAEQFGFETVAKP